MGQRLRCSFCNKEEKDARRLFHSQQSWPEKVSICDDCVLLSREIIVKKDGVTPSVEDYPKWDDFRHMTPKKIKAFLDDHIVGQERAKLIMSVAIYNHYKRLSQIGLPTSDGVTLTKGNILMAGPTGCGKTLIARTIARLLDVPFVVADATTLTEAGYVGEDVENIIKNLWIAAGRNVERTQRGIVCVDEIDKIATRNGGSSSGRDVGGEGVQQALLKMIESGVVQISTEPGKTRPQNELIQVDTTNILFIFTGAFTNLNQVVHARVGQGLIGFNREDRFEKADDKILAQVQAQDFIKFGLIPEFIGRIPIFVPLYDLSEDDLMDVLYKPKRSVLAQYEALFALDNVKLVVSNQGRRAIVKEAVKRKSGARGLRSILEDIMLDIMYELPSMANVVEILIDADVVQGISDVKLQYMKKAS
ncbi:MAG: ATP-dependent Clp protease ATP-binding subunit ClpX [Bradymonadales bacterium]|jgi:ATP-dependent Clp protease ATP-binding subunit ClpX